VQTLKQKHSGLAFFSLKDTALTALQGVNASRVYLVDLVTSSGAKKANKEFWRYYGTAKAKRFLERLAVKSGMTKEELVAHETSGTCQGVYCHPFVAIHYGQWYSDDFAIYCSSVIYCHFFGAQQHSAEVTEGAQSLQQQICSLEEELLSKETEIGQLQADTDAMRNTMKAADGRLEKVKGSLQLLECGNSIDLRSLIVELDEIQGILVKES